MQQNNGEGNKGGRQADCDGDEEDDGNKDKIRGLRER